MVRKAITSELYQGLNRKIVLWEKLSLTIRYQAGSRVGEEVTGGADSPYEPTIDGVPIRDSRSVRAAS